MRIGVKKTISWMAIYAVAIRVVLLGIVPIGTHAPGNIDPFFVICHSASQSDGQTLPDSALIPGSACDHCTLCGVTAPPSAPVVASLHSIVFYPVETQPIANVVAIRPVTINTQELPRGPPASFRISPIV